MKKKKDIIVMVKIMKGSSWKYSNAFNWMHEQVSCVINIIISVSLETLPRCIKSN